MTTQHASDTYSIYNSDCVEVCSQLDDDSIGFSVFSPPFANLYIYSDSERDMGNCRDQSEFLEHFGFLLAELYRITIPGRCMAIHCKDLPAYFHRDGFAGLVDFPGEIIHEAGKHGWSFHSRVTIWKCPVVERERTNNNGLLHGTIMRDRSQVRQGMADYLIVMRKTPLVGLESLEPVGQGVGLEEYCGLPECDPREAGSFHPSRFARKTLASTDSINIWRRYAEPVWWDINQQNVLNAGIARELKDEKHICPLQLDVIERAIQLWSNPGDVVLSPFMGIGSEGLVALKLDRLFIGIELKASYYEQAKRHLDSVTVQLELV